MKGRNYYGACLWFLRIHTIVTVNSSQSPADSALVRDSYFLLVLYVVTKELSEKHYKVVLGGLALWGVDLFNEIWNSMVYFISGYAPVWGAPVGVGDTAWLILIGYNVEISMMFLILGITA